MSVRIVWSILILLFCLIDYRLGENNGAPYCPSKCVCFKRNVRCMKLDLTAVPKTPSHTHLLDLRFNNIREIPTGIFKFHKLLKSLLLNNNLLRELKNGAFTGLGQLRHLYLYKNHVQYIEAGVFQGLPKLEFLYLQSNELVELKDGTFSNLPNLVRLFLYHNKIQHITSEVFDKVPKLTRLRLDQNALICDCKLSWLVKMLNEKMVEGVASCKYPTNMYGKSLKDMKSHDLHCKPPEIMENPKDVEITLGSTAIFSCAVAGDPEPDIIWMRNDEELNMVENKYKIANNGSLIIKNTDLQDAGHYECVAKNNDGFVKSRPARMIVLNDINDDFGPLKFTEIPENVAVNAGYPEVKLSCHAIGVPPPKITWSFNGIELIPSERHIIDSQGSLIVKSIEPSDHGQYVCEASNYFGRIRAEANILIHAAPVFTLQPENSEIGLGETLKMECLAVGSPTPSIVWFKDDNQVVPNNRIFLSPDGSLLEIKNVQESDPGLYICEARNIIGTREVSAKVKLRRNLLRSPKIIHKPFNIEAIIGSTIEMPCKADGDPAPGIQWQKDGATMQRTGRTKISLTGNLYIYNVSPDDQGRYECSAVNDKGRDTASGYLTVKADQDPVSSNLGDKFVKIAFAEASREVDRAINNTIDKLFRNKGPHTSAELFQLFRFPDAPTRELAKAAEVYERTLVNIRKHVKEGMTMDNPADFNYHEILSKEHLDLIASLSGCTVHRRSNNCSDMCFHSRYRSIDGTCNNFQHPTQGASLTGFRRILKPIYEDGFTKPIGWNKTKKYYGFHKPLARLVSTTLIATDKITPDEEITHMVMQWGQFLDHDLDHSLPSVSSQSWDGVDCKKTCDYAAPCFPMDIPPDDPRVNNRRCIDFIRTSAICGSGMTSVFFNEIQPREQINQLTSYIDASQVYGFSEEVAKGLRDLNADGGRLREGVQFPGRKPLLPYASNEGIDCRRNLSESDVSCFAAGDIRVNEQIGLIAMHTVWMREHNRLARELKQLNPHWDSELLYQEARKIVGAAMQHITYQHWLPYIVGDRGMFKLGQYREYNPRLSAEISNVFATAALRFGHTLINPVLHRLDSNFEPIREGHLPLRFAFFSPWRVVDEGGIDPLLRGLFTVPAKVKRPRENLNKELTEQLFKTAHAVALDLAAMNIQRSRDHAIPGYLEFRKFCNMTSIETFDDLRYEIGDYSVRKKLKELYGHPGNIDVWVGGILEDPVDGGKVGPLFQCLLLEQFQRLRDGDRFYYENPSVFKPEQLIQIKQYTLSRVLCDNGDNITKITPNVFLLPELQGGFLDCSVLPKVDLRVWSECCNDCRFGGQTNSISRLNTRSRRTLIEGSTKSSKYDKFAALKNKISKIQKEIDNLKSTVNDLQSLEQILQANN